MIDALSIKYYFYLVVPPGGFQQTGSTTNPNSSPNFFNSNPLNNSNGTLVQIITTALTWEEQLGELSMRVNVTAPNYDTGYGTLGGLCALAAPVALYADWGDGPQEVMRGNIWYWRYSDDGTQTIDMTCYDMSYYLHRSQDTRYYNLGYPDDTVAPLMTAGEILADVAKAWGFSINNTELLSVILPRVSWSGTYLSQMVLDAVSQTYWYGGGSYVFKASRGQLWVTNPASNWPIYTLSTDNVSRFSDEQDIQQIVTEVRIIGPMLGQQDPDISKSGGAGANPVLPLYESTYTTDFSGFGRMSQIIEDDGSWAFMPGLSVIQLVKNIIQNSGQPQRIQRFNAPDLPFLRRGDAVNIVAGTLNGIFVVTGIQHDADQRQMTITIDTSGDLTASQVNFTLTGGEDVAITAVAAQEAATGKLIGTSPGPEVNSSGE